jgi:hypothetical protein
MSKDFDFNLEVSSAHLDSAGWKMGEHHHSNPFDTHVFYLHDFKTGHMQLFTIPMTHFNDIPSMATSSEVCGDVAQIMGKYATGKNTEKDEKMIGPAMALYIKGSLSYQVWKERKGPNNRFHAIINIYRGDTLRPALLDYEVAIMPADEVIATSNSIAEGDRQNHPEWFR